jgi:hypothetical protein
MNHEHNGQFETSDLGQAAFLIAQGTALLGILPGESYRRRFCFAASARESAQGYFRNDAVPARAYFCAVRDLKAMLREA